MIEKKSFRKAERKANRLSGGSRDERNAHDGLARRACGRNGLVVPHSVFNGVRSFFLGEYANMILMRCAGFASDIRWASLFRACVSALFCAINPSGRRLSAHPAARHLKGRMFTYFAEACVIFGNDYSLHTPNVCESFGPVVGGTPQAASVLGESFGDTQVESTENVGGLGEPSSVVDDTTPSLPSVEYSFPAVEYSWQ
ncbi:hypothetical protein IFM89_009062 [Coptis chinensis]|uniref:Uncharacterized protein n=1 Tax=Coptis chinensis TaxID=261450 RepID=A0A835M5A3_9MAGN|nr:hypothetical protein IFM89_009062 [Coptis chinensis]